MGMIYKIVNNVNGKEYVGQTTYSLEERWKRHLIDSHKESLARPLYRAIRKYGKDAFSIELLEETDSLNEREIYWIGKLNTYRTGYNATLGGDGKVVIDHESVISCFLKNHSVTQTAQEIGCDTSTVRRILASHKIEYRCFSRRERSKKTRRAIRQLDKDGNIINEFPSAYHAGEYLGNRSYNKHINKCANGQRKTAYGFVWEFID